VLQRSPLAQGALCGLSFTPVVASISVKHSQTSPLPLPVLTQIAPCIAAIIEKCTTNIKARKAACCALYHLTASGEHAVQVALDSGVIPLMVGLLSWWGEEWLGVPALRVLGNFAAASGVVAQVGTTNLTSVTYDWIAVFQAVVDTGILSSVLPSMITSPSAAIAENSCRLISHVLAGIQPLVQAVIDAGLIKPIFKALLHAESRVRVEASRAVRNLVTGR
jgi:hypothetical protein